MGKNNTCISCFILFTLPLCHPLNSYKYLNPTFPITSDLLSCTWAPGARWPDPVTCLLHKVYLYIKVCLLQWPAHDAGTSHAPVVAKGSVKGQIQLIMSCSIKRSGFAWTDFLHVEPSSVFAADILPTAVSVRANMEAFFRGSLQWCINC